MSFFDKLFKAKSQPEETEDEEKKRSDELMERLKMRRGQETGKWLLMMENASKEPPPAGPPPTIEGIDERQILDEKPYTPPIEAQFMSLAPDSAESAVTPFGQDADAQPKEAEVIAEPTPVQTETVVREQPQQSAAPTTDAEAQGSGFQSNRLRDQINMLATWKACDALIKVIDSDLAWLVGRQGSTDLDAKQSQYLTELSAELHTLKGQVDGLMENYRPTN